MIQESLTSPLPAWESFYVIIGSSAGALTGLQFVVIALIAESRRRTSPAQISAFGTPTIVHFSFVLVLSSILSAPWPALRGPDLMLGTAGMVGIVYVGIVTIRARRQKGCQPVFEDWLWHVLIPFISYAVLLAAAIILGRSTTVALFLIGGISITLLLAGIHNAWDTVTYIVIDRFLPDTKPDSAPEASPDAESEARDDA